MGTRLISMRGDGPWKGRSTRAVNDRSERRLLRLVNGYVSGDGHEIRAIPGFHTILDLTDINNESGFERNVIDVIRPVIESTPAAPYYYTYRGDPAARLQTLLCRAAPTHLHFFEQLRGQMFVVGESGHRKCPILTSARVQVSIVFEAVVGGFWRITLSANPGGYTAADASGAGLNGLAVGDIVWVQDAVSVFDLSTLNDHFHRVTAIVGAQVTLQTVAPLADHGSTIATGSIFRTRGNRTDNYSPNGVTATETDEYQRIDDPDALTSWRVADPLDLDNPCVRANPAWVANRMRDCGDDPVSPASSSEGAALVAGSPATSVSRRRQRSLPYRLNPDVAGDRILMAAPGYSCLFQIPVVVPQEGEDWPTTPPGWDGTSGRGVLWPSNDVHDRPRSAGVPKATLIDSLYTTPPSSPGAPLPYNFQIMPRTAAGTYWPQGIYQFAIAYRDDATGEEGLSSESIEFTIPAPPAGVTGYDIQLLIQHPGYLFPETLALTVNIYCKPPGSGALGFLMSLPFGRASAAASTTPLMSAKYGYEATDASPEAALTIRAILIPAPVNSTPLSDAIDFTRPPPKQRQMPRGAECVRTIRSITMSVGHSGTHGSSVELQRALMSALYDESASPRQWNLHHETQVRGLATPAVDFSRVPAVSTETLDGSFSIGSRYFPSAYQGIEVWSRQLFPEPRKLIAVGWVANQRTHNTNAGVLDRAVMHAQRLRMEEPVYSRDIGSTGSPAGQVTGRYNLEAFLVAMRGQVQVSEPGASTTMLTAAIQFLDANKDDDGLAIGQFQSGAVLCGKRETFYLNWALSPIGQVPQLLHSEIGCIATNSMVEIDGGIAWLSERGPVAAGGSGVQFIGGDLEEDFIGSRRRYLTDRKGLMRHSWGCHDRSRGLVWWGLATTDTFGEASDTSKSRFACDEVLIWNYRVAAFSTWRPPSGLEILWMRPIVDKNGDTRICFMAVDQRVYALDDLWHDTNREIVRGNPTTNAVAPTATLIISATWGDDTASGGGATARGSGDNLLRAGMTWAQYERADGTDAVVRVASGLILVLDFATQTIALDATVTYTTDSIFEFGQRQDIEIESTFAGDGLDNIEIDAVQARYTLHSQSEEARAFAKCTVRKSDLDTDQATLSFTENPIDQDNTAESWRLIGTATEPPTGARRQLAEGRVSGPEIAVKLVVSGAAQIRVTDILLELTS